MTMRDIEKEIEYISISDGNSKMNAVPSVSLLPVVTCAPRVPCSIRVPGLKLPKCYAVHMCARRVNIRNAYARNTRILKRTPAVFFRQLHRFIETAAPPFFRFHVSGDFVNRSHLRRAFDTARAFPDTRFLAFSKRFEFFPAPSAVPVNFSLIASMWPHWGKRPRGYQCAFVQDGTETRITPDALLCHGNCETCGMCWSLPELRRDIVLIEH